MLAIIGISHGKTWQLGLGEDGAPVQGVGVVLRVTSAINNVWKWQKSAFRMTWKWSLPQFIKTSISALLTLHLSLNGLVMSAVLNHLKIMIVNITIKEKGLQIQYSHRCRVLVISILMKILTFTRAISRCPGLGWLGSHHPWAPLYLADQHSLGWSVEERRGVAGAHAYSNSFYSELRFLNVYAFVFPFKSWHVFLSQCV